MRVLRLRLGYFRVSYIREIYLFDLLPHKMSLVKHFDLEYYTSVIKDTVVNVKAAHFEKWCRMNVLITILK